MNAGLFRPEEFRDNCGFGLIAHTAGDASHRLLQTAIESLTCMTHRGGIAADGKTGDGCGLLMQMPDRFMRTLAQESFGVALADTYAMGQIFLGADPQRASAAGRPWSSALTDQGLSVVGWRTVPTDSSVCGEIALASLPVIEQVFVDAAGVAGRCPERQAVCRPAQGRDSQCRRSGFLHLQPLGAKIIAYKGLVMPVDLPRFYLDLADARLETAICVFHQRFSTNTMPRWPLAQPFRLLAHNGEINTIEGNRNWADARTARFETDQLPNIAEIAPLVNRTGSDSSSLDNMLDVLLTGGVDMAARPAHADPAGLAEYRVDRPRSQGVLRVPLHAHGALGWPCRDRTNRWSLRGLPARSQRPASRSLGEDHRRLYHPRLRGGDSRLQERGRGGQGPGRARARYS